jgi:hypothetical protein
MLIVYATKNGPGLTESIVLFIMAALGGVVLIYKDLTKKAIPVWLAIGHGTIAIVGFLYLIVYTFAH